MDPEEFDARQFWDELDNATEAFFPDNLKLSKMLISWSEQRGFPILNITRNQVNGSVFVKQVRKFAHYNVKYWLYLFILSVY